VVGICLKGEEGTKILDRASQWYEKNNDEDGVDAKPALALRAPSHTLLRDPFP
jgi:hypothetical protein